MNIGKPACSVNFGVFGGTGMLTKAWDGDVISNAKISKSMLGIQAMDPETALRSVAALCIPGIIRAEMNKRRVLRVNNANGHAALLEDLISTTEPQNKLAAKASRDAHAIDLNDAHNIFADPMLQNSKKHLSGQEEIARRMQLACSEDLDLEIPLDTPFLDTGTRQTIKPNNT